MEPTRSVCHDEVSSPGPRRVGPYFLQPGASVILQVVPQWFSAGGHVMWVTGIVLAVGMATGGWIGSQVAVRKGESLIRVILYVTLVALAARLLLA